MNSQQRRTRERLVSLLQEGKVAEFNQRRPDQPLDLRGIDLRGQDLTGVNLAEFNLGAANLSGCNLNDAILFSTYLVGANLSKTNLIGSNLQEARCQGSDCRQANFAKASLLCADFYGADLRGAELDDALFFSSGNFSNALLDLRDRLRYVTEMINDWRYQAECHSPKEVDIEIGLFARWSTTVRVPVNEPKLVVKCQSQGLIARLLP